MPRLTLLASLLTVLSLTAVLTPAADDAPEILTPAAAPAPRVNGPSVFGVRPNAPFLYTIPVTGERPIHYSAENLPDGLKLDADTGRITGQLAAAGEFKVMLRASNRHGAYDKAFRIVCGERIALTPPLGWNSWNSWAGSVDQDKVMRSARMIVSSGLIDHGWTYVNIDDTWQGERGGAHHGILGNEKFPDMKKLCDDIHALGLKIGIYSTPWVTSYAGYRGGSGDSPEGKWEKISGYDKYKANHRLGPTSFAASDAAQWADWGFDYLKYDWNPNDVEHTKEMAQALRATGRDIVFSLSNSAPFEHAAEIALWANAWRTTGDIWDTWNKSGPYQQSISEIGFNQDRWTEFGGPGHWNDPDMLVVGWVGWGPKLHATHLTPDEQYTHISLWAMLAAPLLIGCDLEHLDEFTLNLLSNDEVLAIDQDALGQPARRVATTGPVDVYLRPLEDGGHALAFFNRGDTLQSITFKIDRIGFSKPQLLRDVWRQKEVGTINVDLPVTIKPHGVVLYHLVTRPQE